MPSKKILRVLFGTLLATCAFSCAPSSAGELQLEQAVALSTELAAALTEAGAAGPESLLASVYENVRLTPFRRDAILQKGQELAPGMSARLMIAADLGSSHARYALASAPLASPHSSYANVARAVPPGANPATDLAALSEFQRNWGLEAIGTQVAIDKNLDGRGVVVGVIDSGIDRTTGGALHPEFAGRLDARSTSLFHYYDPNLAIAAGNVQAGFQRSPNATEDPGGHGTHVAGIIGAAKNGAGMQGVAPGATILSIQGLASIPEAQGVTDGKFTINGIEYDVNKLSECGSDAYLTNAANCQAANPIGQDTSAALTYLSTQKDVRVINGSYGPSATPNIQTWDTGDLGSEATAVRKALDAGQILTIAAGNERATAPIYGENPSGIGLFPFISPANQGRRNSAGALIYSGADGVDLSDMTNAALSAREATDGIKRGRILAVVATDANKVIAAYSNYCGVAADWCIAAPGGSDDDTRERLIYSTYPNGTYRAIQGTSMAAPHVAGAIAVLIQAFPTYTPSQITRILLETAEDIGAAGTDQIYGRGFLRLDRALNLGPAGLNPETPGQFVAGTGTQAGASTLWTQPVVSRGGLKKEGDGELDILGNASFEEAVLVEDGELQVDGTLTTPLLEVARNGVLSGNGTVSGDVSSNGTVAPGNSPGLLTIDGDVTLLAGNRTEIEIDGPSAQVGAGGYDRIAVIGANRTFAAGGTLDPILRGIQGSADNTFTPALGQGFVFVSVASGQVTGSFAGIVQPAAGLAPNTRFDVIYGPQSLALAATPSSYANLAAFGLVQSASGRSVGGIIDAARPAAGLRPSADLQPLFASLFLATGDDLARGLEQATGRIYVDAGQEAVRSLGRFADQIGRRQSELALGDDAATSGLRLWTIGGIAHTKSEGSDVDTYGGTFGGDVGLDRGTIGAAFRYESGDIDSGRDGNADIDTYQGALYGTTALGAFDLSGTAGLAFGHLDVGRSVSFGAAGSAGLTSSDDGLGGLIEARISRSFAFGETDILPSLTIGYRAFSFDGTTESGRFLALTTPDRTFEEGHATAAVTAARTFEISNGARITPSATIGYRGDFLDVTDVAEAGLLGRVFAIQGDEVGRNAFIGGLKIEVAKSEALSISASYDVDLRDNRDQQSASATLRYHW